MNSPRERAAEGLQVGDRFTLVRCFTDDDICQFAQVSQRRRNHRAGGDNNGRAARA